MGRMTVGSQPYSWKRREKRISTRSSGNRPLSVSLVSQYKPIPHNATQSHGRRNREALLLRMSRAFEIS